MFDGTPDGRLLFEVGNVYKCLSKHDRAEFEVSYGHSVYLEDPVVCKYFIPFESKGEQKPANSAKTCKSEQELSDKVEPKFKVGDWITDGHLHCKISDILDDRYIVDTKFAKRSAIPFKCENNYRLWTIADAKDGDVLVSTWKGHSYIYIFKEIENNIIVSHVFYYPELNTISDGIINMANTPTIPATKEQRDTLMEAMHDEWYEWDAEKKELKKIEQKSAENKGMNIVESEMTPF